MKLALGCVLGIAVVRGTTCSGNLTSPSYQEPLAAEVRYVDIGSGCWVLSSATGRRYEPMQLASEFRHEGLQVLVYYRHRPEVGSICMLRNVIEIDSIALR